jgi:Chaperone of endosialidase
MAISTSISVRSLALVRIAKAKRYASATCLTQPVLSAASALKPRAVAWLFSFDGNGKLGTLTSSARFKDEIKPMGETSEALFSLKPVTFRYKKEIDSKGIPQFGLVAEEVEKVNRDLVVRDKEGKPYSVRYDQVNAMLLNEFLKEHRKIEDLKNDFQAAVAQQRKEIAALVAMVKEQASQIQKVSAQLEASKPAPQVVKNDD